MRRDDGGAGSDVVTGQVDVREIAASLPDLDLAQVSGAEAGLDNGALVDEELLDDVGM